MKSRIGYRVKRRSIENYLRLPGATRVDSTVSCRGASQSPVYRAAFCPIPLSFSTRRGRQARGGRARDRRRHGAKTLTPFGTSLARPPRPRIPRCRWSFPRRIHYRRADESSPRPSEFLPPEHPDETLMHFATFPREFRLALPPVSPRVSPGLPFFVMRASRALEGSLWCGSICRIRRRSRDNALIKVAMMHAHRSTREKHEEKHFGSGN